MEFYTYKDERIRYIGRWAEYNNSMTATAPGSRFKFGFTGESATLIFTHYMLISPAPHLYIRVDGGALVECTLERYLRICTTPGEHIAEIILKSMAEDFPRWYAPLIGRISFEGVETENLNDLPLESGKVLEVVGDSITEGVLIDPDHQPFGRDPYDRPYQDDVTGTYGWLVAEKLGLIPHIMGYGGVGATKGGSGGVVKAADAYPYCFEGAPIDADNHPDYVLINIGSNDCCASPEEYKAGYTELLEAIRAAHPQTKIFAMSVFCGTQEKALEELIPTYNSEHKDNIVFINGSHWLPFEPIHPLREGHRLVAEKLAEVLRPLL